MDPTLVKPFQRLFRGREDAWGTGKGAVVRGSLRETHYAAHLSGWEPGLGIFPLRDDGTVLFAAVDLDEPDYETARDIQDLIPGGAAYVECSRSCNYHVWTFFEQPLEAWVARGILKAVCESVGKPRLEIFPKQDKLLPGMVGNYINLPYHGRERPIVRAWEGDKWLPVPLTQFLEGVTLVNPEQWRVRARRLGLQPQEFESNGREQGTAANLHCCAEKIIRERYDNPVVEGHRHVVMFNLAKMLLDWQAIDDEEAWGYLKEVNEASPEPLDGRTLRRTFNNAKRGGFTSTGCDNPLMAPYVDNNCPIAHGRRKD